MSPDDPRHGQTYGWKLHRLDDEEPCAACRAAVAAYEYRRSIDAILGRPRAVPPHGVRRRLEALQALGWSLTTIGEHMGMSPARVQKAMRAPSYSTSMMLDRAVAVYEALSMSVPTDDFANRRRIIAARKGYAPPLAWDDIDHDSAPAVVRSLSRARDPHIDDVAIERRMAGDMESVLNQAEKVELVRRWGASGRGHNRCEVITGIPFHRYARRALAA